MVNNCRIYGEDLDSKTNLSTPMVSAAVHSKAVFLLLFTHWLLLLLLFVFFFVSSLFPGAVLCVLSRFAIILLGKIGLVALLLWSSECHVSVVLCLFLTVPWAGL